MSGLVAFIFFVFVIVVALKLAERLLGARFPGTPPYERNGKLFTSAERSFLGVLEQIFATEYRILGKVLLAMSFALDGVSRIVHGPLRLTESAGDTSILFYVIREPSKSPVLSSWTIRVTTNNCVA